MARGWESGEWHVSGVLPPAPGDSPGVLAHFVAIHTPTMWQLTGSVGQEDGAPVILDLDLSLVPRAAAASLGSGFTGPDSMVSSKLLQSISVPTLLNEMVALVVREQRRRTRRNSPKKRRPREWPHGSLYDFLARGVADRDVLLELDADALASFPKGQVRRGRPSMAEETARGLLAYQGEHGSKNIIRRFAEEQDPSVDVETMRSRVKTAKEKGYLTSTARPGSEGAYLPGPKLIESEEN